MMFVKMVAVETENILAWGGVNADLFHDETGQDVHDEASQPGIHGEGLDDSAHEQHGERVLVHQLLHHHRQHLRRVHVLLAKAKVGSWGGEHDHNSSLFPHPNHIVCVYKRFEKVVCAQNI